MTNLNSTARRQWITRGRVLVGLPIAFGLILSASVVLLVMRPVVQDVQELKRRRDALLQLQSNLPALESRLGTEAAALQRAEQQQSLLIGMLAGRDKVQTFLALLNQQALFSGVAIQRYEPINNPTPLRLNCNNPLPSGERRMSRSSQQIHSWPWDTRSLRRPWRCVAPTPDCRNFSNRWSLWNCWFRAVIEIKAGAERKGDEQAAGPAVESRTELTMQLSFYDLAPVEALDSVNSKENPPS